MHSPVIWSKPNLQYPTPFDTIFFDIDGVLINTSASFHATDIGVTEYITGTLRSLDWGQSEGKALLTMQDLDLFKQAGGYNNDWNMCFLLVALATARLREWRGTALAERSTREWAELSRAANLQGHGGLTWAREVIPATALPDYDMVGEIYREYYWGADELRKRYGYEPRYLPNARGLVQREELLYPADLQQRLRDAGIRHFGIITGRIGPEVDSALERMTAYSGERWWEVVIPANVSAKPDPEALRLAIKGTGARGGLYIGDTADDFDLVRHYRAAQRAGEPDMLVAMRVPSVEDAEMYKQRQADFVLQATEDVQWCLPHGA
ncbi:MAG TPA: HAD family hydrolase [Ktedonobacteraceae bacterium]|nr:HAD family hydrolase [Ktedonobacteraceae bacterium]